MNTLDKAARQFKRPGAPPIHPEMQTALAIAADRCIDDAVRQLNASIKCWVCGCSIPAGQKCDCDTRMRKVQSWDEIFRIADGRQQ